MKSFALAGPVLTYISMLLLAICILNLLRRGHFPYTIGLVIAGLIVGVVTDIYQLHDIRQQMLPSHDVILYILLPPLVYEASMDMELKLLRNNLFPILLLAIAGLVISTFLIGALMFWLTPLLLIPALVFGALISATDPVAVIAIFRELKVPAHLSVLMDGESLFNDATAIVMFQVMLGLGAAAALTGPDIFLIALDFLRIFLGGTVVGAICGCLTSWLATSNKDDRITQITLSIVTAWGSFVLADHYLKLSGVMACVSAGLVSGYFARNNLSRTIARSAQRWWHQASFLANSYVFLMLGLQEEILLRRAADDKLVWSTLILGVIIVLLARACIIYGLIPSHNTTADKTRQIPLSEQTIMFWGGLRGAVPMALVLSLPPDFPQRNTLFNLTQTIILWTLLIQGTTMTPLLRRLLPRRHS